MDTQELLDLASERLGGSVLYATDDFFAPKENLLKASKPVWKEHEYTDRGKWMDGWESRRKRTSGHDFAIVRLGAPGLIRGILVDTSFFRGNFPSHCSIEACSLAPETDVDTLLKSEWVEVLPKSELKGDSENFFHIENPYAFSHLRFHIYPDGGVARLRVYGEVVPEWHREGGLQNEIDLAAVEHGGQVLTCSDMFFGPKHNLIMPGAATGMNDGWETRRRRGPGNDWVVVQLGAEANITRIEIDTSHFKGNYPDTCSVDGDEHDLLPRTKLLPDTRHVYVDELNDVGPVKQLRLNVFPDGGVARLRVYGHATEDAKWREVARRINTRVRAQAEAELRSCCGSAEWVRQMLASRPFDGGSELLAGAETIWWELEPQDWREAFAAHPRIGENPKSQWAREEQAGASSAPSETMRALADINREYEKRFGHIFIVFATGKTADEMLALARQRMQNQPEQELRIAAEQQLKITKLRLMKLVS
ncbi:MAG TPA: allantoicase [Thermoanaerobaculia bacterium]|nr:allantoicase [Thermoanaerobaculia bacterium]